MLIDYLPSILALTTIQLVGLISPGPDFAIVVRNSLVYSRKTGLITALGVAFGIFVHLAYILLGMGIIISNTIWLFHFIKYLGAGYLIYLGICGLKSRKGAIKYGDLRHHKDISPSAAFRLGFLTNALNVKCILFFLSVISAFITPEVPNFIIFIYGNIIFFTTLIWFFIIALCFSHKRLRLSFSNARHWIERTTGSVLLLLGIRMLFIEAESIE